MSLDDESAAWEEIGMQSLAAFFEKIHDHGMYQTAGGDWKWYPSGKVGEICKTCGKLIEEPDFGPADQVK